MRIFPRETQAAFPKESQLQQCCATQPELIIKCMLGSFHVSVIHQTLTWTIGSLTCVRDHSCVCVYTWGLGTQTESRHIFDSEWVQPNGIIHLIWKWKATSVTHHNWSRLKCTSWHQIWLRQWVTANENRAFSPSKPTSMVSYNQRYDWLNYMFYSDTNSACQIRFGTSYLSVHNCTYPAPCNWVCVCALCVLLTSNCHFWQDLMPYK